MLAVAHRLIPVALLGGFLLIAGCGPAQSTGLQGRPSPTLSDAGKMPDDPSKLKPITPGR